MPEYLTVAELGNYMHMSASIVQDDLATFALDVAEDVIRDYLEHEPITTEITERLDGNNGEALLLTGHPVTALTSVMESDASLESSSATELVEDTDFTLDYNKGILYRIGTMWLPGNQNIEVEYAYGPEDTPNRVKVVGYQIATRIYLHGQDEAASTGSWSATYVKGGARLTDDEMYIIRNLKR